jgi:hypothetical protein
MSSTKKKLRLVGAFAALATLALALSCTGFFPNPKLTGITIGPTSLPLTPGQSFQMVATGTFDNGNTSTVTSQCLWTSTDTSVASIGLNSGMVTASSTATTVGTTQINASDGTFNAPTAATVTVCPTVSSLTISASPTSQMPGQIVTFMATANFPSQSGVDVTNVVTWNISDTGVLTISGGVGTINGSAMSGQSTTVSATLCSFPSNTVTITVN